MIKYLILIGLTNIYMNYSYSYCYKYLTIKHNSILQALVFATIHHFLYSMIVWIYVLLIYKSHSRIASVYWFDKRLKRMLRRRKETGVVEEEELNRLVEELAVRRKLELVTRSYDTGQIRICLTCQLIQPDRCYHCTQCARCILKRDHHCPWLQTCIGYSNQKHYHLLLVYSYVYLVFILSTSILSYSDRLIEIKNNCLEFVNFNLCQLFALLALAILQLLLINRAYLTARNLTCVEYSFPPRLNPHYLPLNNNNNIFDQGNIWANFSQVFGKHLLLALFPVDTSIGNGHIFPVNSDRTIV